MPFPLLAPIIAGAGQLINSVVGANQNRKQRSFDKGMADYSYSKDLDMWNKANAYNTPQMQMQRFEDAGLNKNMIYGQGTPGLTQASMPKYQDVKGSFNMPSVDLPSIVNAYQDFRVKNEQVDLLKQQVQNQRLNNSILWFDAKTKPYKSGIEIPDLDEDGNPLWGQPKQSTGRLAITDYDLNAKEQQNKLNQQRIIQETNASKWSDMKISAMDKANVNIDHDSIINRYIAEIFGDLIQSFSGKIKQKLNYFK